MMTTIAYDGVTLATDSRVTSDGMVFGSVCKIITLDNGGLLASAGDICLAHAVADWLNGNTDKPQVSDKPNYMGLLLDPKAAAMEITQDMNVFPACVPWAGGSGEAYAMTAMLCGKSAIEAVKIACKLDIYSGLPVHHARHKK